MRKDIWQVRVKLQVGWIPRQVPFALHPIASDVPGLSLSGRIGSRNNGSCPQRAHSLTPILSNFSFQHLPSLLGSDHPGFLLCHKSTESTLNILLLYPGRLSSLHCSPEQSPSFYSYLKDHLLKETLPDILSPYTLSSALRPLVNLLSYQPCWFPVAHFSIAIKSLFVLIFNMHHLHEVASYKVLEPLGFFFIIIIVFPST